MHERFYIRLRPLQFFQTPEPLLGGAGDDDGADGAGGAGGADGEDGAAVVVIGLFVELAFVDGTAVVVGFGALPFVDGGAAAVVVVTFSGFCLIKPEQAFI